MKSLFIARTIALCVGLWVCFEFRTAADVESNTSADAQITIEKAALFKNGLGFFTLSALLPPDTSTVRLGQIPVPSFGTLWVDYPPEVKVRSLVSSMEELEEAVPVQNLGQLLQSNVGRRVILRTGPGEQDVVEGTLTAAPPEPTAPEGPNPYIMDYRRPESRYTPGAASGNVFLIQTEQGIVAVNAGSVLRADFGEGDVTRTTSAKRKRPSIRMELERPSGGERISVSYLAKGITWAPSYRIDLSDPETARFSAQALVINEVADLDRVQLDLVTGFPNIIFGEVPSPMAMSQNLADFLNALTGGRVEERRGVTAQQAWFVSNAASYDYNLAGAPPLPGYSSAADGLVSEDLFLYPVGDFTLKKGETAWVPLFTAQMPYQHVYTWKVGDSFESRGEGRPEGKNMEEVWHSCRLVNNLKMPLTTAAAEFVKDGAFAGQDVCYYTAPGAETTIHINKALNIKAEQSEIEVARTRNAGSYGHREYDAVTVRGELKLRSRIDKAVRVEITKEVLGEVREVSRGGQDTQIAKRLQELNPRHVLTWKIELKPDEEKTLSYEFQTMVYL